MKPTPTPRVKICCIRSQEEARLAIAFGASALGLVSAMPSGPGVIAESKIAEIACAVPPPVMSVLLTSLQDATLIAAQHRRLKTNALQLTDRLTGGNYDLLRDALPGVALIQVIHVTGPEALAEAVAVAPHVHALLLDSGNPSLAVKELGGTGRRHDWRISREIREAVSIPLFLAGGLTPENVREAIETVGPFGLDICSGVRTNGVLDSAKLVRFWEQL